MEKIANGIWKVRLGEPEVQTPFSLLQPDVRSGELEMLDCEGCPVFSEDVIRSKKTARGFVVELPLDTSENIYGFGLQLYGINQMGKKKYIRVNSDPVADTGDSHAPAPFYVSTAGYGVYVDTARYVSFYCGTNTAKGASKGRVEARKEHEEFSENALYAVKKSKEKRSVLIDVPAVGGVDLYFFEGPDLKRAVQRYNLFSGGGCLPPEWGLGVWYRAYGGSNSEDVYRLSKEFREEGMPIDVYGLEPGWHTHSYSCSYKFDEIRFPDHERMLSDLNGAHYKVNLWEHAFVHPTADIYDEILPYAGDFEVWNGLVPDYSIQEAKEVLMRHHGEKLVDKGVMGFKLDECDNSDFNPSSWSFPNCSEFPSGLDGEQMHNMIGMLYQQTITELFESRNKRTLSQVRASGALASAQPFVLYSDLYDHKAFIRGVASAGFSGLLWSPEVRSCENAKDLIRRVQTVMFSPQALLNCWRIPNPPWKQVDLEKNLAGIRMADWAETQAVCRKFMELRMSLIPYLYSCFARYRLTGLPPFRALVMDWPEDENTAQIDDIYMMGDDLLVAPMTLEDGDRKQVYLPAGDWHDFFSDKVYVGGRSYEIECSVETFPVFVRSGALLPLAEPKQYIEEDSIYEITVRVYAKGAAECVLYEDDGFSFDYKSGVQNTVRLIQKADGSRSVIRAGGFDGERCRIIGWEDMK